MQKLIFYIFLLFLPLITNAQADYSRVIFHGFTFGLDRTIYNKLEKDKFFNENSEEYKFINIYDIKNNIGFTLSHYNNFVRKKFNISIEAFASYYQDDITLEHILYYDSHNKIGVANRMHGKRSDVFLGLATSLNFVLSPKNGIFLDVGLAPSVQLKGTTIKKLNLRSIDGPSPNVSWKEQIMVSESDVQYYAPYRLNQRIGVSKLFETKKGVRYLLRTVVDTPIWYYKKSYPLKQTRLQISIGHSF